MTGAAKSPGYPAAFVVLLAALLVPLGMGYFLHAKKEGELTKIISRVYHITISLRTYVRDEGQFPPTLGAMMESYKIDKSLTFLPHGATIEYKRPLPVDSKDAPVVTVHFKEIRIVVTKEFERKVVR